MFYLLVSMFYYILTWQKQKNFSIKDYWFGVIRLPILKMYYLWTVITLDGGVLNNTTLIDKYDPKYEKPLNISTWLPSTNVDVVVLSIYWSKNHSCSCLMDLGQPKLPNFNMYWHCYWLVSCKMCLSNI